MLGSLRYRLPALFLLGVVLAGLVATLIAIRFFQSYTRSHAIDELRAESVGIVQLYARQTGVANVPVANLERAIGGDQIFYIPIVPGAQLFVGRLPSLPLDTVPRAKLEREGTTTLDLHVGRASLPRCRPPVAARRPARRRDGRGEARLAAAQPLGGADRAARDRAGRRRDRRRPARRLSVAADHEAAARALLRRRRDRRRQLRRRGAAAAGQRRDIAPLGAVRRHGREARRVGAAVTELPDDRLPRAAHAADGDPRPCVGASRGRDRRSGRARGVARRDRRGGVAPRAARRRRARPREARRAPLHRPPGRGGHGAALRSRVRGVRGGCAPPRDRLPAASSTRAR